jgi:hypothetical protein
MDKEHSLKLAQQKMKITFYLPLVIEVWTDLRVGTSENGSGCGRWLTIRILFCNVVITILLFFNLATILE